MTLGELLVKIKVDKGNADNEIKGLGDSLKSLNVLGIASAGAIGVALVKGLKACINAAAEAETITAKLNAVIKSTGGVAGVTSNAALELAESLKNVTAYDDDAIVSGETLLLTFTKIGKDVFPQATEAMLDMTTLMGGDMKSAAIQVGKALQDPVEGASALRRVGIQLSDSQEKQITKFMTLNNVSAAQNVVLKELNTQMGGIARAAVNTYSGAVSQASNAFGDLKKAIGGITLETGIGFMKGMKNILQDVTKAVKALDKGLDKIKESFMQQKGETESMFGDFGQKAPTGPDPWALAREKERKEREKEAQREIREEQTKQYREAIEKIEAIEFSFQGKRAQLNKDGLTSIKLEEQKSLEELQKTNLEGTKRYADTKLGIEKYYVDLKAQYEKQKNLEIAQQAINSMQQITGSLSGIFNQYMTNKNMELDNDLYRDQERIQTEYDAEKTRIESTVTNEREKARQLKALDEKKARDDQALQKRIEKQKRKAAREAAEYQKAIAITDAIMNTARGVTSALGMFPPPVAWAMAAITAALGAAQVTLIAQQPLPAAAAGGVFNTPYIGGEAGTEMAVPLTGSQGQTAIQALASGMLDVMSQAVDTRASVSSASAGASGGGGGDVYLDGALVGQWLSRGSNNGMFTINRKVVVA